MNFSTRQRDRPSRELSVELKCVATGFSRVQGILHFPYILSHTFGALNHIDHIGHLAVGQSFDMVYLPSY